MHAEPVPAADSPVAASSPRTGWRHRPRPPLVENVAGQPVILWRRLLTTTGLFLFSIGCGQLLVFAFARMPLNSFAIAAPLCMYLMLMVVLVERERHIILLGSNRWRISLAGMLIVVALISIVLATLVAERRRSLGRLADQQALSKTIGELPGVAQAWVNDEGVTCEMTSAAFSDADLRRLAELAHLPGRNECILSHLFLSGTAITDDGLAALAGCQTLTLLDVSSTAVSDAGLAQLADCRGLRLLLVQKTQVTTSGLVELRSLPKLKQVFVAGTSVATDSAADQALPGVEIVKQ